MIILNIAKYGWHGNRALLAFMADEAERRNWRVYLADMLCYNVRPKYVSEMPLYSSCLRKSPKGKEMSAEEVKQHILQRLQES